MQQTYNFNPGPAVLPRPVLEEAQRDLLDFQGTGMSILEISHRSKQFEAVAAEAEDLAKELYGITDGYRVLFLQGGASTQFAMAPMNLLPKERVADYILTGAWSEKALAEAEKQGCAHVAATTGPDYKRVPDASEIELSDNPAYVHVTSNNTIYGTQWRTLPTFGSAPIVCDMSSDVFSRPVDMAPYGLVYAGLQKNAGTSGGTMVIIRADMLERDNKSAPSMLRYSIHAKNDSLYNTPPVFAIYIALLTMRWLKRLGGLAAIAALNEAKASLIYDVIDGSEGFYRGHADAGSRSLMNITFRVGDEEAEKRFLAEAKSAGFVGLAGHRSVGGVRASTYNALSTEACQALADFMMDFAKR